jgi:ATP-dependent Clp protease, protease subunit
MKKGYILKNKSFRKRSCANCNEIDELIAQELKKATSGESEEDSDFYEDSVSAERNEIFFYGDVDCHNVLQLNKSLKSTSLMMQSFALDFGQDPGHIILNINSPGGNVTDGLLASDYVRKSVVPVHTVVNGACASAATFVSIVGKKRFIYENSFMLLHQMSAFVYGKYFEIKDEMQNCDMIMNVMRNLYKQYTKIPSKVLETILKRDLYLTAKECLKYGLIDEII